MSNYTLNAILKGRTGHCDFLHNMHILDPMPYITANCCHDGINCSILTSMIKLVKQSNLLHVWCPAECAFLSSGDGYALEITSCDEYQECKQLDLISGLGATHAQPDQYNRFIIQSSLLFS